MFNYIVALSNLVALPLIYNNPSVNPFKYFTILPMVASFLYHLAETNHGLPGISPLNRYAKLLLTIDRFFAFVSSLIVLNLLNICPTLISFANFSTLLIAIVGILSLLYSERDIIRPILIEYKLPYQWTLINRFEYTVSHVIWHFTAFYFPWGRSPPTEIFVLVIYNYSSPRKSLFTAFLV